MMRFNLTLFLIGLTALVVLAPGPGVAETAAGAPAATAQVFRPPPAKDGHSYPDCYCTDSKGRRVEMGEVACLTIGSRQFTARCEMSLNNPMWRHEAEGCPLM